MLAILLTLSGFAPLDSLPETVQITGPDTAVGNLPVTLTYCATGLLPNSVSQWNSSIWAFGTGPYPPFNNPGTCQNFNLYLMPSWVPVNPVISCTNTAGSATFSTWIIPQNSDQTFTGVSAPNDSCETQYVQTTSSASWYRIDPPNVVLLPHRWQYRDSATGAWTDFLAHPGNITGIAYSAMPTDPALRITTASDSAFGVGFTDTTNYHFGTSRLNWAGPLPGSLNGLWVRHVLERYQGSTVYSDSVQLQAFSRQVALAPWTADTLLEQQERTFRAANPSNFTQFLWTVSGGTPLNSVTDDSITVRWDSLGIGQVRLKAWTAPGCSSTDSAWVVVKGLGTRENLNLAPKIWPNPSSGSVTVLLPTETVGLPYAIWDQLGRCIARGTSDSNPLTVKLVPGIYLLYIQGFNPTKFAITSIL